MYQTIVMRTVIQGPPRSEGNTRLVYIISIELRLTLAGTVALGGQENPSPMFLRQPYQGSSRKLVLAFDVGTTFSGISYCILDPGEVPTIRGVSK